MWGRSDNDTTGKVKDNMEALGNKTKQGAQEADQKTGLSHGVDQAGNKMKEGAQEADKRTGASHGLNQMGNKVSDAAENVKGAFQEHVIDPAAPHVERTKDAIQKQFQGGSN
jgi:hypothetical protein